MSHRDGRAREETHLHKTHVECTFSVCRSACTQNAGTRVCECEPFTQVQPLTQTPTTIRRKAEKEGDETVLARLFI